MERCPTWKFNYSSLADKIPSFYKTWKFITMFTRAHHVSLSWARSIQSPPSHPLSCRSIHLLVKNNPHLWKGLQVLDKMKFTLLIQRCLVKMFTANVCPVTQSFKFGRVMPPLQQKSRVLHVVTDNKQRTTLKARRNLWHFQTQTKNRDIQSLGKLKGSAEAAGRHSLNAVNMMDRSTVRWGTGIIGVEIYPILRGQLGVAIHPIRPYLYISTRLNISTLMMETLRFFETSETLYQLI